MFFKKKKEAVASNESARVKILGSGCSKCNELEANTLEALRRLGQPAETAHVTDFAKIAEYGVMRTPALVLDDTVLASGQVFSAEEIVRLLENAGM